MQKLYINPTFEKFNKNLVGNQADVTRKLSTTKSFPSYIMIAMRNTMKTH